MMNPSTAPLSVLTLGYCISAALAISSCRCTDTSSTCWPSTTTWRQLNVSVNGNLVGGASAESPLQPCASSQPGAACELALNRSSATEFWNMQFPGGFQSSGLYGGFSTRASEVAIMAQSAQEIQTAVAFAATHGLRLIVKGAGHDYMGRNTATAPGSLLISTQAMKAITWSGDNETVTVEAGVVWQDVYLQAQERGRFVLGGHCPSVGAAGGFPTGAGYGPNSRMYGTAADNMLSASVVVASGELLHCSETSHPDLFWALRGGGGGTFGVITNITYKTHSAPTTGGNVAGTVVCPDTPSYEHLLSQFVSFLPSLFTPHWGDSVTLSHSFCLPSDPSSTRCSRWGIQLSLRYLTLSTEEARALWEPWERNVQASSCQWSQNMTFTEMPTVTLADGRRIIHEYPYPGAHYPHTGDPQVDSRLVDGFLGQLNQFSLGQTHRYVPEAEMRSDPTGIAQKLLKLSRFSTSYRVLTLSKALAGGGGPRGNVSANPAARLAGVSLMGNEHVANYFPQLPETRYTLWQLAARGGIQSLFGSGLCDAPDSSFSRCLSPEDTLAMSEQELQACWAGVHACFRHRSQLFHRNYTPALRAAFQEGSYVNEGDYFEPDWQRAFWGENYQPLLAVKRAVDPKGLFVCRHCVGSEDWTENGNCRIPK